MKTTATKIKPAEPLCAVPEGDKLSSSARRLALGFGLMLGAGALSDGGVLPLWGTALLLAAGLAVLCSAARKGGAA
ncbi:MAG TPA: hypothetical protein H9936_06240 [Candidatus Agathobaculum intestinigallinarum]|nr:hypothetical protein [Candidatus Agathobaculum intestinigallinarum]